MSDNYLNKVKGRWLASGAAAASGGTTVTKAAVAAGQHSISHASASGDAAALVTIESPTSTVIWRKRFAGAFTMSESFDPGQVEAPDENTAMSIKVSASTANVEANIAGYTI